MSVRTAPYGSWESPIKAEAIASGTLRLQNPVAYDRGELFWQEGRPSEGGRVVVVRRTQSGEVVDAIPAGFNARTLVHEYGGGAYVVKDGIIYFSNYEDQRLYSHKLGDDAAPRALTPAGKWRYADACVDLRGKRLVCVREDHSIIGQEATTTVVAIPLDGGESAGEVLVSGNNFYSNPRVSPDGSRLCWLTWNHPNMPWDGTELWVAELDAKGAIASKRKVAGGQSESIFQPEWSKTGVLYFIGDRTGWWNPYAMNPVNAQEWPWQVVKSEKEFGLPHWVFGMSTYALLDDGGMISAYCHKGKWRLCKITVDFAAKRGSVKDIDVPFTDFDYFALNGNMLAVCASSSDSMLSVVEIDTTNGACEIVRKSNDVVIDNGYISVAEVVQFPTADGATAYAFVYKPTNVDFCAPNGELPPLLVESHGGPTSASSSSLNLHIQYWTSRGFVVADVNYRGSTGYGRAYRDSLKLQWGVADVQDCENVARFLARKGTVDPKRMAITGGSAGGYTTLCALTFGDVFHAGASHYGIGDVSALATDTHKFEARYLDTLIGPYPQDKETYEKRSPLNFTEKLTCPVIFFQGLEDKAVPPSQAEAMVAALRKKKLPVAYITYAGEQHGFRKAENIKRTLEAEFYFYSRIFKFSPAEEIEPVQIDNLDDAVAVR